MMKNTNEEVVFEAKALSQKLEEIAKELDFQANQAKRDQMVMHKLYLDKTLTELLRLEILISSARSKIGI